MSVSAGMSRIDHAPLLERAFDLEFGEQSYRIEGIEGEIPSWLKGTYYINGPACFRKGAVAYRHWLDGDGQVVALKFDDDGVLFTNRFVRSTKFVEEEQAGKALFRTFGTAFEGDHLERGIGIESPVNVSVHPFAGKLLAFGEQGLPWELDPSTLETLGEHTFGEQLRALAPFSAHPCFDPESGEMFNFGVSFSKRQPSLQTYRFSRDGVLLYRRRLAIEYPASTHDFILSNQFSIFYFSPYVLDVERIMRDGFSIMEALSWRPELGSRLVLVAREDGTHQATISLPGRYCLHLINAFEEGPRLFVDLVELDRPVYDQYQTIPDLFSDVGKGRPVRFIIDLETKKVLEKQELAYDCAPDFPTIDPRQATKPYGQFWMLGISKTGEPGRKFFDELVHLDWSEPQRTDLYRVAAGSYLGCEPIFIGHPDRREEGVVLTKQFDPERREDTYLLFDSCQVGAGPKARLPLREAVPAGFHASWAPS